MPAPELHSATESKFVCIPRAEERGRGWGEVNSILKSRYAGLQENRPNTGSDSSLIVIWYTEKPVKPSFSVPVENKPYYRPVCQNKADLHLT